MPKKLLFLLFTVSTFSLQAQKQYLFHGKINTKKSLVKEAHIINLTTGQGTYSNEYGEYRIYASLGDSLRISSVQHVTRIRIVTGYDLKSKVIDIELEEKTYELEEVVLKKTNLSGSLLSDMRQNKNQRKEINAVTLGLPNASNKKLSQIDRKLYTLSSSSSGVPLDLLFSILSGRYKKLKEEKRLVEENNDVEHMLKKVAHFLVSDFNIKEEYHYRFLYYCRTDSTFTKKLVNNELALIKFLQKKSKEFNQLIDKNAKEKE